MRPCPRAATDSVIDPDWEPVWAPVHASVKWGGCTGWTPRPSSRIDQLKANSLLELHLLWYTLGSRLNLPKYAHIAISQWKLLNRGYKLGRPRFTLVNGEWNCTSTVTLQPSLNYWTLEVNLEVKSSGWEHRHWSLANMIESFLCLFTWWPLASD